MNEPNSPAPDAQPQPGVRVFWFGLFLQLSALIGLIGTVLGMQKAFHTLGGGPTSESFQVLSWKVWTSNNSGVGNSAIGSPEKLSAAIGQVLESTIIGWAGNNLGVLLCLFALWHYQLRRPWMFWTSMALGCFVMPFGLFLLIYCLLVRHEFFGQRPFQPQRLALH